MESKESSLVIISFIFTVVLYLVTAAKGPRVKITKNNVEFNKSNLPKFTYLLTAVALLSVGLGFLVSHNFLTAFGFAGLNLFIAAIMGVNLFLYRYREKR